MAFVFLFAAVFVIAFFGYAIYLRRRDAAARRAWEQHCNEQALANDAALAARRAAALAKTAGAREAVE